MIIGMINADDPVSCKGDHAMGTCEHVGVQLGLTRFDRHPRLGLWPRGRMSDHGEHGQEEAAAASLVHPGVQGRDRRVVPARDRSIGQVSTDFDLTETAVRLKEDVEILKRATAFFAKETR
jgi:hypothetical protein